MCLMITGFAFAFMVVSFGLDGDVFQHPLKSGMTTLTMMLGEFNFGDLYQAFGRDWVSRGFAMFLLLVMIILGTITMVNLFVVVIISDLSDLQTEVCFTTNEIRKIITMMINLIYQVFNQNLVNMATASILVEALLPAALLRRYCMVGHSDQKNR